MTIPARFENGVFRPLRDVPIKEGTVVEVLVPLEAPPRDPDPLAIRLSPACGRTVRTWPTASNT